MRALLKTEYLKLRKGLSLAIVGAAPTLLLLATGDYGGGEGWEAVYYDAAFSYAWLFLPILSGVYAALVCRAEHLDGGWKHLLARPVRRWRVYAAKYVTVMSLVTLGHAVMFATALLIGLRSGLGWTSFPWGLFVRGYLGSLIAVMPLAALQLAVSMRWKSFAGPLGLNVTLALPSLLAAQSPKYGPWYPWAQPVLAMVPSEGYLGLNVSVTTLVVIICGGFVLAFFGGMIAFSRGDIHA
ncbi:MAG: ABC transporter permease [Anaerosomatales bacterium]|nr:ABC transporter permease [Anaerosomatales bacterium]